MVFRMALIALFLVSSGHPVWAQTFPPDTDWEAPHCGGEAMHDPFADDPDALGPLDVVGNLTAPVLLRFSDDEFLYLRLRVEDDPTEGTSFSASLWGVEFDTDGDTTTYEILAAVDGIGDQVVLYENRVTTLFDDPADPADEPAVATYALESHARSQVAGTSTFGDGDDYFIDFALAWADLESLGLSPTSPTTLWTGSSSAATGLDGDIACQDRGAGQATLSDSGSQRTASDPNADSDDDGVPDADEIEGGSDPDDPNDVPGELAGERRLEGGGGCSAAATSMPLSSLFFAVAMLLCRWPTRRRQARPW